MNKTNFETYDKEYLQEIINGSTSIREVLIKLGLRGEGANHRRLTKFLRESDYDTTTLVGRALNKGTIKGQFKPKELSKCLIENGSGNSNQLRERLIKSGVKEHKCECCGITEWNGREIKLELHHINGDHFDNRLENLIILCPNCHSQTPNFRGKNCEINLEEDEYYQRLKIIAERNIDEQYQELLKREEKRREEVYLNHLKNGDISKGIRKPREKRYCKVCGKEIIGQGEKFCSYKCMHEHSKKNNYDPEILLEQSKNVHSLVGLGKLYNITDNGIKKQLKNLGILEEVKNNFKSRKNIL